MKGRGGHYNRGGRRCGGDRPFRIEVPRVDPERAVLLATLKTQIANAGVTGDDLREIYGRLEATDTSVLREAVETAAVERAEQLAGTVNNPSPDGQDEGKD